MDTIGSEYLKAVIRRVKYYKDLADKTFEQLDNDQDFDFRPNEESNSISVIIRHMSGNMLSRWTNALTEDGEKEWRQRDEEFAEQPSNRKELMETWEKGWKCFLDALASFKDDDLLRTIQIRKEDLTLVDAINRQLAHYPYHVGQIVYIGRMILDSRWKNLSIPRGRSQEYNLQTGVKDPARRNEI